MLDSLESLGSVLCVWAGSDGQYLAWLSHLVNLLCQSCVPNLHLPRIAKPLFPND